SAPSLPTFWERPLARCVARGLHRNSPMRLPPHRPVELLRAKSQSVLGYSNCSVAKASLFCFFDCNICRCRHRPGGEHFVTCFFHRSKPATLLSLGPGLEPIQYP